MLTGGDRGVFPRQKRKEGEKVINSTGKGKEFEQDLLRKYPRTGRRGLRFVYKLPLQGMKQRHGRFLEQEIPRQRR